VEWLVARQSIDGFYVSGLFDGDVGLLCGAVMGIIGWSGVSNGWRFFFVFALAQFVIALAGGVVVFGLFLWAFKGSGIFVMFVLKNIVGGLVGWLALQAIQNVMSRLSGLRS